MANFLQWALLRFQLPRESYIVETEIPLVGNLLTKRAIACRFHWHATWQPGGVNSPASVSSSPRNLAPPFCSSLKANHLWNGPYLKSCKLPQDQEIWQHWDVVALPREGDFPWITRVSTGCPRKTQNRKAGLPIRTPGSDYSVKSIARARAFACSDRWRNHTSLLWRGVWKRFFFSFVT